VASHIGVRDLERSVTLCNRNREFPKRDFPTYPEAWVLGGRQRTGGIGDRESGTREVSDLRHRKFRFPDG
jgi:hypothetical protein